MKMVKKILLGTLAVAAILSFAGCQRETAGNDELIKVNSASSKASIDYTNDGDVVTRGFKSLNTKHLDAICKIEMEVTDLVDKTVDGNKIVSNGTMGYIFNIVKGADEKYAFSIAGVRYNQSTGEVQAYVESFSGIEAAKLEESLEGGVVATGLPDYGKSFGFTLLPKAAVDALLTATPGKITLWIDLVANGKASADATAYPQGRERAGKDGSYTVSFYAADPARKSSATTYDLTYTNPAPLKTCYVEADNVNAKYDATKGLTSMQSDVGFYANVYAGQTLKGTWEFSEIKKEAEEIEE